MLKSSEFSQKQVSVCLLLWSLADVLFHFISLVLQKTVLINTAYSTVISFTFCSQWFILPIDLLSQSLCLTSQVPVDNCWSGVRSFFPTIPQRHSEGSGGNVSWSAASTPGLVPQELPVAVHAQHPAWWWRAGWVRHSVSNGCDCTSSTRVLWLPLSNLNVTIV